jgi:lactate racemase
MTAINMPYGKSCIKVQIPSERLLGILESRAHSYKPEAGEEELVKRALENPIGSPRLRDLVKGRKKIVIIASDHTRPVPTKIIAPQLLAEIRKGNPDADIAFLIATGFHRATTKEELLDKFGPEMLKNEKIVIHDCRDEASMINAGRLPSGGDLVINKMAMEADLLLAEGFIEPHLFAGFSGARKSVLPGIVSEVTVMANHCAEFVAHEKARPGILEGNPMHEDMVYAAKQAKLAFILNVVIDADKKIIKAFAGGLEEAHLEGCRFAGGLAEVKAMPADIVITSNGGYPLDQNVYQHVKSLTSAEATCRKGGVIIATAACSDGHGSQDMYDWMCGGAKAAMDKIMKIDRDATIPDQWATQVMARVQLKHTVIFVTDQCVHNILNDMGFKTACTFEEAMSAAEAIVGSKSTITVIPDGVAVVVN